MASSWADRVQNIICSLQPLPRNFKPQDEIISFSKRQDLMDFVKFMTKKEKSVEFAREYMNDGDNKFQSGLMDECLLLYSKTIFHLPNSSTDLANAYVKRSLVLLHLGYYYEASRDLEMALSNGFSEKEYLENVIHMLHCENHKKAETSLEEILIKSKLLPAGEYRKDKFKAHPKRRGLLKQTYPKVRNDENPDFPSSSKCLQVLYDNDRGRYVVVKCDIKAGDILFVERPFAFSTQSHNCSMCGQDIIAPIPCLDCPDTYFCSEKCRNNAYESHKFECGFSSLLQDTGAGYLALKIILNAASDFERLKTIIKSINGKKQFQQNPITFSKNMYENVYHLQTNLDRMFDHQILPYALTATYLALYLVHRTKYARYTDENVKLLAEILLHHIAQIQCNAHTIVTQKIMMNADESRLFGSDFVKIGAGIYPSVSMMNHSCEPSVINSFLGVVIIVRACKDILKGEEVFNNYGADSRNVMRLDRHEILQGYYYFDCKCPSCSQDIDPCDLFNSYKCEQCLGPLVSNSKRNNHESYFENKNLICLNCGNCQVLKKKYMEKIFLIENYMERGREILQQPKNAEKALGIILNAWKLGRTILYKFHLNLLILAILMGDCFFLMGDYKRCISVFKCTVLSTEARFGRLSKELAIEGKKLGDSVLLHIQEKLKNQINDKELNEFRSLRDLALQYYDIAENIFKLFYGEDHPLVFQIVRDKQYLQYVNLF